MKLNESQIAEIQKYILDWKIEYKSFYDEMLDHFIADIEAQMENGEGFYTAFNSTSNRFTGKVFSSKKTEYFGLKAFEMEAATTYSKSFTRMQNQALLKQITSWRLIIWAGIGYLFYKFPQYGKFYFMATVSILLIYLLLVLFFSKPKFSIKMFYPENQLTINERVNQLKGNIKIGSLAMVQNTIMTFGSYLFLMYNAIFYKNFVFSDLSSPFRLIVSLAMCMVSIVTFQIFLKFSEIKLKIQWP
ncbi:hypothetical protein MCERE19_02813 [Spirosomataceae bacterium]|jgi:hypothetical protein